MSNAYTLTRDSEGGPGTVYGPDGTELDPSRSQEIKNHSPEGFQWGYGGSGPRQLALALLLDVTDDRNLAAAYYRQFKTEVISEIDGDNVELSVEEIERWLADHTDFEPEGTTSDPDVHRHDGWQSGEPCPECGYDVMHVMQVSSESFAHADGECEHVDHGAYRQDLQVTCKDCQTVLFRHPAMDKLPSANSR